MAHEGHWFKCGNCGYVGEESELKQIKTHDCGADKCPECKGKGCIICCFESYDDAEIEYGNSEDCECSKCHPEYHNDSQIPKNVDKVSKK